MQIFLSSSYVKNVSSCSPAHSLCPNPDSCESRESSSSEIPSSSAARPCVTYFGTWLFIVISSRRKQRHSILFNRKDHRLIDVHIPAFADSHANRFAAILQQRSPQRHLDISQGHLQHHMLPHPTIVCAVHSPSEEVRASLTYAESLTAPPATMVQRGY